MWWQQHGRRAARIQLQIRAALTLTLKLLKLYTLGCSTEARTDKLELDLAEDDGCTRALVLGVHVQLKAVHVCPHWGT